MGPQNKNGGTTPPLPPYTQLSVSLIQVSVIVPFLKLTDFLLGMDFYILLLVKWSMVARVTERNSCLKKL
jgi:hypothetical protein